MKELVLAIDVGTSGVRSMVFDTDGNVLTRAHEEFESQFPRPSWVEQKAEDWWRTACKTIRSATKPESVSLENICGISVTNQRETVVPIDEDGADLRSAIVWQDRRTVEQCDWIHENIGLDKVYRITGLTIDPYFTAPKILWMRAHEPEVMKKTHKFMLVHDYIIYRLSGREITDYSNASRTMLFDIKSAKWSKELLSEFNISEDKLPEALAPGELVGDVTKEAAEEAGLKMGTPVVSGGGDQQCAALGVGVVREGLIKATTGTGTFMLAFSKEPRFDPQRRVLCSRHVVDDSFVVEASMFTTGSALRWFRDHLGSEEVSIAEEKGLDPYEVLTEEATEVPPGSEGVFHIPHFAGAGAPYWNPYARGLFAGLALGHTRYHLMRAILEGVAYELRTNLEVVRELNLLIREMRVTGGAARSNIWMQIQSDILDVPIIQTELEEATALGAAILACRGVGVFDSVADAAERMVRVRQTLKPRHENRKVYDEGFRKYKDLYSAVSQLKWD